MAGETGDAATRREEALARLEQAREGKDRVAAVNALVALAAEEPGVHAPSLLPRLPALLAEADGAVRAAAVALAARVLPEDEVVGALSARLDDAEGRVRLEATGQLADLHRPDARAALAKALEDADPLVRFEAARGMAALKHPAGLEVLVEALEARELRFRALGALGQLGDTRAVPAVRRLFRRWLLPVFEKTQAAGVLARLGEAEGAAHLLARLGRRWTPDRAMAAELCGEARVTGARERLLALLADPREPARGAAARGLGRLGDAAALGPLTALLEDTGASEDLRLDAAEGLCFLGLPEGLARVRAALPTFAEEGRAEVEALLEFVPTRTEVGG